MSLERGIGLLGWLCASSASVEIGSAVPVGANTTPVAPTDVAYISPPLLWIRDAFLCVPKIRFYSSDGEVRPVRAMT